MAPVTNPRAGDAPLTSPVFQDVEADAHRMLREVHESVVSSRRSTGLQTLTAVILSLATLMSTWCGYQASRWSGVQGSMQSTADTAERQAAENMLAGLQIRTQDGLLLLEFWRAVRTGDEATRQMLMSRMRPELQSAVEASIRQGILKDPKVVGPLHQPEYVLESETRASADRDLAKRANAISDAAGGTSSSYVLLTLLLASTLFIGGISGTFSRQALRRALAYVAVLVFTLSAVRMSLLPVLWPNSSGPTLTAPAQK
jgi:hypothetical protein